MIWKEKWTDHLMNKSTQSLILGLLGLKEEWDMVK